MRLYHFTSEVHLPRILEAGRLEVTESNVDPFRAHAGPDVVWLTDEPDPARHEQWARGPVVDKLAVRFTVEVPRGRMMSWAAFSHRHRVSAVWRAALERSGGDASTWWVSTVPVTRERWVAVEEVARGGVRRG
jgi:hypothetical protein